MQSQPVLPRLRQKHRKQADPSSFQGLQWGWRRWLGLDWALHPLLLIASSALLLPDSWSQSSNFSSQHNPTLYYKAGKVMRFSAIQRPRHMSESLLPLYMLSDSLQLTIAQADTSKCIAQTKLPVLFAQAAFLLKKRYQTGCGYYWLQCDLEALGVMVWNLLTCLNLWRSWCVLQTCRTQCEDQEHFFYCTCIIFTGTCNSGTESAYGSVGSIWGPLCSFFWESQVERGLEYNEYHYTDINDMILCKERLGKTAYPASQTIQLCICLLDLSSTVFGKTAVVWSKDVSFQTAVQNLQLLAIFVRQQNKLLITQKVWTYI